MFSPSAVYSSEKTITVAKSELEDTFTDACVCKSNDHIWQIIVRLLLHFMLSLHKSCGIEIIGEI